MRSGLAFRLVCRGARYRWRLNRPEIARMLRVLPRGGSAIDVGAHKGGYSFWMARRVGPSGRVLSVEPQPRVAEELRASLVASKFTQAEVVQAAVSDRSGQGTFHIPRDSTHGASLLTRQPGRAVDAVPVRIVTIDELVNARGWTGLDFIKIDAEGNELPILAGARGSLERFKPSLLVESEPRAADRSHLDELSAALEPLGYSGWFHDGRSWRPLADLDIKVHQEYGTGRYCNNIFFSTG